VLVAGAVLCGALGGASPARAQACLDTASVAIGSRGFEPESVCILSGGSVHWTNASGGAASVVEPTGHFDSATLAAGAGFSVTLGRSGEHRYASPLQPGSRGFVVVALEGIDAPPGDRVNDHLPAIAFPTALEDEVSTHPYWGYRASRKRILIAFQPEATVAEANAALAAARVVIAGALPRVGILLAFAEDTPDFSAVEAAIASLEADPSVEAATLSEEVQLDALPRPIDDTSAAALAATATDWVWGLHRTPGDKPFGVGGNWNLEASRFPQAWNLREAIVRKGHVDQVVTGVLDNGYETHDDHSPLQIDRTPVCKITPSGLACTDTAPGDHGHLVAGIIASTYDNDGVPDSRSLGVSGVNPNARVRAIRFSYPAAATLSDGLYEIVDLVLDRVANLRLLNFSFGLGAPLSAEWWENQGTDPDCGPGPNDDKQSGANEFCNFNNDDDWLKEVAARGVIARKIAELAASRGVVIAKSAGNRSYLCSDPYAVVCPSVVVTLAANVNEFAWASQHWTSFFVPDPIVLVENVNQNLGMGKLSNAGGHVAAPGDNFARATSGNGYGIQIEGGTSSATPHVAGLLGQMLAFDPGQNILTLRYRLLAWTQDDTPDFMAPRIDAFAAMLSIPGAARALVDVNDESAEGNRRVIRGPPTATDVSGPILADDLHSSSEIDPTTGDFFRTAPDGVIDMRDFRRFRDARTQLCIEQGLELCPDLGGQAFLDGADDHPKKDLNFDRCVFGPASDPACPGEINYPRFDFNGDGLVSAVARWPVPLRSDGTPAASQGEATEMTDLEVLMSQWHPDPVFTEGYTAADLPILMNSADVHVAADQLFAQGAGEVELRFESEGTAWVGPVRRIPAGERIVYTVPAGIALTAVATTEIGGETVTADPFGVTMPAAGLDGNFDLCRRRLVVSASPSILEADGVSQSTITARVETCGTDADFLDDPDAVFTQDVTGPGHGQLVFGGADFDDEGIATTIFRAGTIGATYVVTVSARVPGGPTGEKVLGAKVTIRTADPARVYYRWQQEVLDFEESGTSRWPAGTPGIEGDCDGQVIEMYSDPMPFPAGPWFVEYRDGQVVSDGRPGGQTTVFSNRFGWGKCVDHFALEVRAASDRPQRLAREGVLKPAGSGVLLDESVSDSTIQGRFELTTAFSTEPAGSEPVDDLTADFSTRVSPDALERYRDHPLPTTSITSTPQGLRVAGLGAVADLEYPYDSTWEISGILSRSPLPGVQIHNSVCFGCVTDGNSIGQVGSLQADYLLVPREDRSALRYRGAGEDVLVFPNAGTGEYGKYSYCEIVERSYTTPPEYYTAFDLEQEGLYTRNLWPRNTTFVPATELAEGSFIPIPTGSYLHEYPMPVGPGTARMRYSFVAIPYRSEAELEALKESGALELPDCDGSGSLTAAIDAVPNPAGEGGVIAFGDASQTGGGNSIVSWQWDFGDGTTSAEPDPSHRYADDGDYTVRLDVVDAVGRESSALLEVSVENLPPVVQVDDVFATVGEEARLVVRLADAGELDRTALQVRVESSQPGFPTLDETHPAGIRIFALQGLPAGSYPVTVTATDPDGAGASDTATLTILAVGEPPPPPDPPPPPTPTCDPSVTLDGEEQAFLDRLNDYRLQSGVPALEASPALTVAAGRHALDMATEGFLDHVGSDASTPGGRAFAAGYPTDDVGENLAQGLASGVDVLFGWRSSPEHDATLLDPSWSAVGIARAQGADWYWAADFGEVLDCAIAQLEIDAGVALAAASPWHPSPEARVLATPGAGAPVPVASLVHALSSAGMGSARLLELDAAEEAAAAASLAEAQATAADDAGYGPVSALVVGAQSVEQGRPLSVRNRTRDADGLAIPATVDFGDGVVRLLQPDQSFLHSYALPGSYVVSLTATDVDGLTAAVARSVEVTPQPPPTGDEDFNLLLSPDNHVMGPGDQVDFVVTLAAIAGFDEPVTLSVGPLPAGVTASFAQNPLVPSATTLLRVAAADDAATGEFEVQVTAEGGGRSHTTATRTTLDFGLVPLCFGAVTGVVRDVDTGEPVTEARVQRGQSEVLVDSGGRYNFPIVPLGLNNAPVQVALTARASGYVDEPASGLAVCGQVTELDIDLTRQRFASLGGRVFEGIPDPEDPTFQTILPTSQPVPNAQVRVFGRSASTDADGDYLLVFPRDVTSTDRPTVLASGFWQLFGPQRTFAPGDTANADFAIVRQCTVDVTVTVRFEDGEPAAGVSGQFRNGSSIWSLVTDANGRFRPQPQLLAPNNAPTVYRVVIPATNTNQAVDTEMIASQCGADLFWSVSVPRRTPYFGVLRGVVRDLETGDPVAGVTVRVQNTNPIDIQADTSDAEGRYEVPPVLIGHDGVQAALVTATVLQSADHWGSGGESVTLQAGRSIEKDLRVLRRRYATIVSTVLDVVTRAPIEGATVRGPFTTFGDGQTDANGIFVRSGLELNFLNTPKTYGLEFEAAGYWPELASVTVEADQTHEVTAELIPVCEGATVLGSVVNAANGQPLPDVRLRISRGGSGFTRPIFTDAAGNYIYQDVTVGTDNTPLVVNLEASKTGFQTQFKQATIFCGARVVVEFGQPSGATGAIEGTVTDGSGAPIPGVFIGSGFGAATTTNTEGYYRFEGVPLGPGGADRVWSVTAAPPGRDALTRDVTAVAGETVRLDFVFGDNRAPVADAGPDRNTAPGQPVTLDGSNSFDPDGDLITFEWSLDRGAKPAASALGDADLVGRDTPMPELTPDVAGVYEIELVVRDAERASAPDSVAVVATAPNAPPNAHAGEAQSVFLGDVVELDGSASEDPDQGPQPLAYAWRFASVPPGSQLDDGDIADGDTALARFVPDAEGSYTLELRVDDGEGDDTAAVAILVERPNVPPNARAGEDLAARLGEAVVLDGGASDDPDLGPDTLAFGWRFVSVPAGSALTSADLDAADTASPRFTPDVAGSYLVELQVSDGEAADFDNVLVVVSPPDVEPPPAVGDLTARAKPGKIDLVWSPVEGAVAYDVYRGLAPAGPYERIAADHASAYAAYADFGLADGVTYYYVVRALGPDRQESPDSNQASATPSARTR
jgi:uncharacterized protein YkwD/PKD repeat protein/plastocyanin